MTETLLGLFTEVAILEHLVRVREDGHATGELSTGHFGLLNYFITNHPEPDSIASIAWGFQEEFDYTKSKVLVLADNGLVSLTPIEGSDGDAMVAITDAGRDAHGEVISRMAPDIRAAVAEIPFEDLKTTFRTLREIRLTLDNLPDR